MRVILAFMAALVLDLPAQNVKLERGQWITGRENLGINGNLNFPVFSESRAEYVHAKRVFAGLTGSCIVSIRG